MNNRWRIGLAHPFVARGGSEAMLLWAAEGLKKDFEVSIVTTGGVDFDGLNSAYGTELCSEEISVDRPLVSRLVRRLPGAALRGAIHQRHCRRIASDYDVLLSIYNPCDFGKEAIHFVADFSWHEIIWAKFDAQPEVTKGLVHRDNLLRRCYLHVARTLRRPSGRDLFDGDDIIVAISQWTLDMMRLHYPNARLDLVYLPVVGEFSENSWETREDGFVCLGRVAHEKRVEIMIDILAEVRRLGHDVHMHVIGGEDGTPYGGMIRRMAAEHGEWVRLEGPRYGREKADLLTGHRYAIHARRAEPFGIAVAEIVRAGCVPFVPDAGGPPEIVGGEPALVWRDKADAVKKIDAVLRSDAEQRRLRAALVRLGDRFSVEAYQEGIRGLVEEMLRRKPEGGRRKTDDE